MAQQNYGEILKYTAILAAGFVAVRVALYAKDALAKGAKVGDAVLQGAKQTVQDVRDTAGGAGISLYNAFHGDANQQMQAASDAQIAVDKNYTNLGQLQITANQGDFRRQELGLDQLPTAQESFRASELLAQNAQGTVESAGPGIVSVDGQTFTFLQ